MNLNIYSTHKKADNIFRTKILVGQKLIMKSEAHIAYCKTIIFGRFFKWALLAVTCTDPEGGAGGLDPPPPPKKKNDKNKVFLSNTGLDPLKNHKATKPAFNVGPSLAHQPNAI